MKWFKQYQTLKIIYMEKLYTKFCQGRSENKIETILFEKSLMVEECGLCRSITIEIQQH